MAVEFTAGERGGAFGDSFVDGGVQVERHCGVRDDLVTSFVD